MSEYFIKHPVFSAVVAIIIMLCGLTALFYIPLAQYPNITPPTITITAHYPGADAMLVDKMVAFRIEDAIDGVDGMSYMNSVLSSNGDYNLIITFAVGTDLNNVIGDVLNRLNSAIPQLPDIVQKLGVVMHKSSQNMLMSLAIVSGQNNDLIYLSNYVDRTIYSELIRVPGVSKIDEVGKRSYAMRVLLHPGIMSKFGITISDVKKAILEQNVQLSLGKTGDSPTDGNAVLSINLNGQGYYSTPKQFANIIVGKYGNGYIRVSDIATVKLSSQSYDEFNTLNNSPSIGLNIYLDSHSNALTVHNVIVNIMNKLARQFPFGIKQYTSFDNTNFIKEALKNVFITFLISCLLVISVIYLFLQNLRAALVPLITIPLSIVGTFAIMMLLHFSFNNLTLFGLILSIGIVVDDSIVVIENVERIMHEQQCSAFKATLLTMKEVQVVLISIVLVLCCAFIPAIFVGGLVGVLYRQFAVTIALSIIISGFTALTISPALCAYIINNKQSNKFNWFNKAFDSILNKYLLFVKHILRNFWKYIIVLFIILIATVILFIHIPSGFIVSEDNGYFMTQISLAPNSSVSKNSSITRHIVKYLLSDHNVRNVVANIGLNSLNSNVKQPNTTTLIVSLKSWNKRDETSQAIIDKVNHHFYTFKYAKVVAYNKSAIDGIGNSNGVEFYIVDKVNGDYYKLTKYLHSVAVKLRSYYGVTNTNYAFSSNNLAIQLLVDVNQSKYYGVSIDDIYQALHVNFNYDLVNYFSKMSSLYWVILSNEQQSISFDNLFVKNRSNNMVSLASLVHSKIINTPSVIEKFNGYVGAKLVVNFNQHTTFNQVMTYIDTVCKQLLPKSYSYFWYGISYQQSKIGYGTYLVFIFAVIMIFLVLAAQFEMWRLPFVIILGIPFALFGALLLLYIFGLPNDLYFQISLITLLGLSAKNCILMTEFAINYHRQGMSLLESILLAARVRFRPIVMTSMAFVIGTMPLIFSSGANAHAEHAVGTGILGGMIGATVLTLLFIPMIFLLVMGAKNK